ncbi:hypothetical protein ARTHRO9AX_210045 [Arthrobacter sp. 9AX]|nr:hypothetical protein ARTHRO9AX_210045 [Arthrobacter sp. 9AX]
MNPGDVTLRQKAFSQKLTKGYTRVKKPFTLVRSRFFNCTTARGAQDSAKPMPASPGSAAGELRVFVRWRRLPKRGGHDDQRRPHGR